MRKIKVTKSSLSPFYVIGVGPGNKDYLLPIAKKTIQKSDCLIGAKRSLLLFKNLRKEKILLEGHFDKIIPYIKEKRNKKRIAVLVSGDPGLYSFLANIKKHFAKEDFIVIPGISSLQLAFSKIGEVWQDTEIISLHGRKTNNLAEKIKKHNKVFLFTDSEFPPEKIAEYLLKKGIKNKKAIVFENLSYPDEKITETNLKELSKMRGFSALCTIIIQKM